MSFSVMTNPGAASAVLNLNRTLTQQNVVQERMNTGLKVASAKDNAATFAIAMGMRSDVAAYKQIRENLNVGKSTVSVASEAAKSINSQLTTLKEKIAQAANQKTGRDKIQLDVNNALKSIEGYIKAASVNGVNLIDGDVDNIGKTFDVVSSLNRDADGALSLDKINVAYESLSLSDAGRGLGVLKDMSVETTDALKNNVATPTERTFTNATWNNAGGELLTLKVKDAAGKELTFTHSLTAAQTEGAAATALYTAHEDALKSLGITGITSGGAGSITVTRSDNSTAEIVSVGGTAMTGAASTTSKMKLDVASNFDNKALGLEDEIKIGYKIGATSKELTLRVSQSNSGTILDSAGQVLSLKLSDVEGKDGNQLATLIKSTLDAHADFAAASASGAIGTGSVTGSTLTMDSNAADAITGVTFTSKSFDKLLEKVDSAEKTLQMVSARLGAAEKSLAAQGEFMDNLVKATNDGIGTLVDANMAEESARFQALQVQQQLGVQALSIANQAPQAILSLFR